MKNVAHIEAGLYLIFDTDLSKEEFQDSFNKDDIYGTKVEIKLPNGQVHKASFADIEKFILVDFENNKDEEKEKATKHIA